MGEAYRARDTELDREVAVKVLLEAVVQDPDRIARFEREAKVLASLNHQNIATLHGLEEHEGQRYLVMELATGETLAERLQKDFEFPSTRPIGHGDGDGHGRGRHPASGFALEAPPAGLRWDKSHCAVTSRPVGFAGIGICCPERCCDVQLSAEYYDPRNSETRERTG
jgi:hypothetical protein